MLARRAAALQAQPAGKLIFPDETDSLTLEWGRQVVEEYLQIHQMPVSEVSNIQIYGRQDLRDALKSYAWIRLRAIISDPNATLDSYEQRVMDQYAQRVKTLSAEALQLAVNEKNRYLSNRCTWKPDATLSQATGYTYDGAYYCPSGPYSPAGAFSGEAPLSPPKDFFVQVGQKKSWLDPMLSRPGGTRSVSHISLGGLLLLGIGLPGAIGMGALLASIAVIKTVQKILFTAKNIFNNGAKGAGLWVGVAVTTAIAIALIVLLIYVFTENQRIESEYSKLDSELSTVLAAPVPSRDRLAASLNTPSGGKVLYMTFLHMTIGLSAPPNPAALPTPTAADPLFALQVPGTPGSSIASSIALDAWDNDRYLIRPWGNWFLLNSQIAIPNSYPEAVNTRIRYRWFGKKYEADRMGAYFAVRKVQPEKTDVDCPPDPITRVSTAADLTKCTGFVSLNPEMDVYGLGRRKVSLVRALSFANESSARVALNQAFSIPIVTTGLPEATITVDGSLPAGFSLTAGPLLGEARLNWTGSGSPVGSYSISLRASNGFEQKTQTLSVLVTETVGFTAPALTSYTFEHGQFVSIPVKVVGYPVPNLFLNTWLGGACGLQMQQINTSEYLLSGYMMPPTAPSTLCMFTFEAANSLFQRAFLDLKITVAPPSKQPYLTQTQLTTTAIIPKQHRIELAGVDAPVNMSLTTGADGKQLAPPWVSLREERNGVGTLTVTPPADAPDEILIPIWYRLAGSDGNKAIADRDGIRLRIAHAPLFVWTQGSEVAWFSTVGAPDQRYGAQAQDGTETTTFTLDPPLPAGLRLETGRFGAFNIIGRPEQAGEFEISVSATNRHGTTTETVRILATKPALIDPNATTGFINFYLGRNNRFEAKASGFPIAPVGEPGRYIPEFMRMWTDDLSQQRLNADGLRLDTQDPATGEPYFGRVLISGTPLRTGTHFVKLWAQTAGLAADEKYVAIKVTTYGDVDGSYAVDCGDISYITNAMGRRRGLAGYVYNADINQDGVIDVRDLAAVSSRLPTGTKCQ